jgi:hypothetical protein
MEKKAPPTWALPSGAPVRQKGGDVGIHPVRSFALLGLLPTYLFRVASPPTNPIGSLLIDLPTPEAYHLLTRRDIILLTLRSVEMAFAIEFKSDGRWPTHS